LIPLAIQSILPGGQPLQIFGSDYATLDGTAVRDYVHVSDLANAHALAVHFLRERKANSAFNLGMGKGYSVREVLAAVHDVTGRTPVTIECERRAGDPPILVADPSLARQELCWTAQHSNLSEIVSTAWQWFKARQAAPTVVPSEFSRAAMAKR
jgi:UDP-glucose 4-epimerase